MRYGWGLSPGAIIPFPLQVSLWTYRRPRAHGHWLYATRTATQVSKSNKNCSNASNNANTTFLPYSKQ